MSLALFSIALNGWQLSLHCRKVLVATLLDPYTLALLSYWIGNKFYTLRYLFWSILLQMLNIIFIRFIPYMFFPYLLWLLIWVLFLLFLWFLIFSCSIVCLYWFLWNMLRWRSYGLLWCFSWYIVLSWWT